MTIGYPVQFSVDYPDRQLNRLTSALRIFTIIPIAIVLGAINDCTARYGGNGTAGATTVVVGGTGLLFLPPPLMILLRQKSIFDYIMGVIRWHNRVVANAFILVTDVYPLFRLKPRAVSALASSWRSNTDLGAARDWV